MEILVNIKILNLAHTADFYRRYLRFCLRRRFFVLTDCTIFYRRFKRITIRIQKMLVLFNAVNIVLTVTLH